MLCYCSAGIYNIFCSLLFILLRLIFLTCSVRAATSHTVDCLVTQTVASW